MTTVGTMLDHIPPKPRCPSVGVDMFSMDNFLDGGSVRGGMLATPFLGSAGAPRGTGRIASCWKSYWHNRRLMRCAPLM